MRSDKRVTGKRSDLHVIRILLIFLFLFLIPSAGFAQEIKGEEKEASDKFSYLIENGARMIRENEFEVVLTKIQELPSEKKWDFRIKVLENFAYLKGYLITKKHEYGKAWQNFYKPMVFSGEKIATPILIELLKDNDPYIRAFTARALAYLGDKRALDELKRVAEHDKKSKVRSRAKWAYEIILEGKTPGKDLKEPLDQETGMDFQQTRGR